MNITLTRGECRQAALLGVRRRLISLGKHAKDCYAPSDGGSWWDRDIEAAGAEMAAARALGLAWVERAGDFSCSDLETGYEVRHTKRENGHLIIRPGDKDGVYILVTGSMPNYDVVGWISSQDVRSRMELGMGPTMRGEIAYWVKQSELEMV